MKKTKEQHLEDILSNSVYLPDSGMRQLVYKALSGLSCDNLANLSVIIGIKETDAADRAVEQFQKETSRK